MCGDKIRILGHNNSVITCRVLDDLGIRCVVLVWQIERVNRIMTQLGKGVPRVAEAVARQ